MTIKQILKRALNKRGYFITSIDYPSCLEFFLYSFLRKKDDLFFIQIGANDGKMFDPIYRFVTCNHKKVRGIVIEPLKDFFEELKVNYRKYPNIRPLNIAIHNSEKEMTLYRTDPGKMHGLPEWAKGIASFDKEHHKLSNIPSDVIIPEAVKCMSLGELLERYHVTQLDLLQIDTEGYDTEIILNIDFEAVWPGIICFEHGLPWGIMDKQTFSQVTDHMHSNGYELMIEKFDAIAYRPEIIINS